jgi:hypothetical protein
MNHNFEDRLEDFLRDFAEARQLEGEWADKYGTNMEDDKFMMHRFCWCEKDDCPWCGGEIIPELMKACGFDKEQETAPNFWYKPLGFKVWWYKYIGRGMRVNKNLSKEEFERMVKDANV